MKQFAILILMIFFLTLGSIEASEKDDVVKIVEKACSEVLLILKETDLDIESRQLKIVDVVLPIIDFHRMIKLAIGEKHWFEMSPEKRAYLSELLIYKLRRLYLTELIRYENETVYTKNVSREGNKIEVDTVVVTNKGEIDVTYCFLKTSRGWKAYDAHIFGVSMVNLYRRQFQAVLKVGTIDDLIDKIERMGD